MFNFSKIKIQSGFTLVEMLVAVTLFIIIISVTAGVFINSLRTQQAVIALISANDNASLALEQMAREIRTGSQFTADRNGSRLSFVSQKYGRVVYSFNVQTNAIERNNLPLTGNNVKVDYLYFDLLGAGVGDGKSTRVTIRLGVSSTDSRVRDIVVPLQTTISSRQLDV